MMFIPFCYQIILISSRHTTAGGLHPNVRWASLVYEGPFGWYCNLRYRHKKTWLYENIVDSCVDIIKSHSTRILTRPRSKEYPNVIIADGDTRILCLPPSHPPPRLLKASDTSGYVGSVMHVTGRGTLKNKEEQKPN